DGTVMKIGRTRPHSAQSRRPIFSRAPNTELFWRFVSFGFEIGEELIETIGQFLREHFRAMRVGPDLGHGIQTLVAFRSAVTTVAIGREQRLASFGRFVVDLKWIAWRQDFLGEIGLAFHVREYEVAALAVHGRAQA